MLNKLDSTARITSPNTTQDISPTPMRMDAAHGQRAQPRMDSPSTLRLRATTDEPETSAQQPTDRRSPSSSQRPVPNPINPIKLVAKLITGILALSAGHRLFTHPGDFVNDPGGTLLGIINLAERTTPDHIQAGNQSVLEHYGKYIPDNSPCFGARAEISHDLPSRVLGIWTPAQSRVALNANIAFPDCPSDVAMHEFVHCYTHPDFKIRNEKHPSWQAMNEGLTTHLTEKMPSLGKFWNSGKDAYHRFKLPTGDSWPQAAQRIENKVGETTLLRAFFSGDDDAIRQVSIAAAQVYPQVASQRTESQIWLAGEMRGSQQLAECYAGALLAAGQPLPDSWARNMLPVFSFSDITPDQAKLMQEQAQASRQRMGELFDAAFFSADLSTQKQSLAALREDLLMYWEPVLQTHSRTPLSPEKPA